MKLKFITVSLFIPVVLAISTNLALGQVLNSTNSTDPFADFETSPTPELKATCQGTENELQLNSLPILDLEKVSFNRLPWSKPVIIRDSFTEEKVPVVLDRNFEKGFIRSDWAERGNMTVWGLDKIIASFYIFSDNNNASATPNTLSIKAEGRVFDLSLGANRKYFTLSPEVIQALLNTPEDQVSIRMSFLTTNRTETFNIGGKTIVAWKKLYNAVNSCTTG